MNLFIDRIHRLPRIWSNRELRKFAHLFKGDAVNVSGWKDEDKEGRKYAEYFQNAKSYSITNFKAEARGFQGFENEIFLDLEADLPDSLSGKFETVFNHTTLEHIFKASKAFSNLCEISSDIVILVLPFLQQYHSSYGDYWRFSPLAIKKMFEENGMHLVYQSFNGDRLSSVYTFSIATKNPEKWKSSFDWEFSCIEPNGKGTEPFIGCLAIPTFPSRVGNWMRRAVIKFGGRGG